MTPPVPEFVLALREHVGTAELWLPGVTAVVRREGAAGTEVLLVRRADNGAWTPVTGILEPGEDPAVGARREALEETGVEIRVDRLAAVRAGDRVTHVNGDRSVYLDHTFACTWVAGEARVADDENTDVRWCPVADLDAVEPPVPDRMRERIAAALSGEVAARFVA